MAKTAKRQLKKNNTKKMKGGMFGLLGLLKSNAPVNTSEEDLLNKKVDDTSITDKPKPSENKTTLIDRVKSIFSFTTSKNEKDTQQGTQESSLTGGRRRNTKKATRKAKKGGRIAKKGARKANKSRRTKK